MKEYLLFDLDGTLTDPKIGITTCVQYALKDFGIDEPDLDKLEPFIGPPLKDSFMQFYNMTEEEAERAIAKYRERFSEIGIFENEVYAGIPEMLQNLQNCGMFLAVASSKPTEFVERILEHFDLRKYFRVVVGSEMDGTRVEKEEVMMEALRMLFSYKPIQFAKVYMVGDRKFDIEGAKAIGVESVGVSYGYGSKKELKEAQADHIVDSVAQLQELLMIEGEALRQRIVQKQPQAPESREKKVKKTDSANPSQQKNLFQVIKPFIYPFLVFVLIKFAAQNIILMMLGTVASSMSGPLGELFFVYGESGQSASLNGTFSAIVSAATYIIAAAFIYKIALKAIVKTKEEEKPKHETPDSIKSYVLFGITTVCAVVGINLFLELMHITNNAEVYQSLIDRSVTTNIVVGIICSGIIIPVAEELVFRGMLFNLLKRHYKMTQAILLSSLICGFYYMNSVEGMYAALLGCLAAYAYEYFGDFLAPVLIHVTSSVLTYVLTNTALVNSAIYSRGLCAVLLVVAVIGGRLIMKAKKIL